MENTETQPSRSPQQVVTRWFPIMVNDDPRTHWPPQRTRIPWKLIAPHEAQAFTNHGQTLTRLAERGGLSACEAVAIIEDKKFYDRWHYCEKKETWRDQQLKSITALDALCAAWPCNAELSEPARKTKNL